MFIAVITYLAIIMGKHSKANKTDSQSNDLNEGAHGDNTVTLDATFVNSLIKKIDNLCIDRNKN